jgi:hypothetical protein
VAGTPADYGPAVVKVPDAYTGPEVGLMVAAVLVEAGQKKIPEAAEKMAAEAEMVAKGVKATADQIELNAGVGVLMAEQKLQETQEQLKKDAVLTEINVAYGKKQAKDTIAEVKDKIEEVKDKISEGWDKVVESANKAMDKAAEIVMTSLGDPDAQKMYEGHVKQMKTELQDLQSAYNTRVQMAKSMPETQATDFMGKVADAAKAHIEAIQKQQETERERARSIDPRHRQDYTL